jgi:antibiotic biosynthesis monooxygenase (ABM) superfamily enzyme
MNEANPAFEGPATLIFTRRIKPGRAAAYKAWVAGFQDASRTVKGFLGASTLGRGATENEYISIVRFDSFENLCAWEESGLRHQWVTMLPPDTVDGEADVLRLEGLEFWFTGPGVTAHLAPSAHKMALVLVIVVLLLVSVLTPALRTVLGDAPPFVRTVAMVLVQVGLMTYVIMPRVTRLLSRWLFR